MDFFRFIAPAEISPRGEFFQTRVHKSLIYIGNLARHSFFLFDRNKTQPQTSKTSEQRLAERWTIEEIRRQSNSVLTYYLLTDVLPL